MSDEVQAAHKVRPKYFKLSLNAAMIVTGTLIRIDLKRYHHGEFFRSLRKTTHRNITF
jgi:hypothetical protein